MNNLKQDGAVLNLPLFLADWTGKVLKMRNGNDQIK